MLNRRFIYITNIPLWPLPDGERERERAICS